MFSVPSFILRLSCDTDIFCVLQAWEGNQAAKYGRIILGATHPADSAMGTVRGDFCIDIGRYVHVSALDRCIH